MELAASPDCSCFCSSVLAVLLFLLVFAWLMKPRNWLHGHAQARLQGGEKRRKMGNGKTKASQQQLELSHDFVSSKAGSKAYSWLMRLWLRQRHLPQLHPHSYQGCPPLPAGMRQLQRSSIIMRPRTCVWHMIALQETNIKGHCISQARI